MTAGGNTGKQSPRPRTIRVRCGGNFPAGWPRVFLDLFRRKQVNIQRFWLCDGSDVLAGRMETQFMLKSGDEGFDESFLDELNRLLGDDRLTEARIDVSETV